MADTPKIQIDSDWKAEAQKEKERLAKVEAEKSAKSHARGGPAGAGSAGGSEAEGGPLPPADFRALVSMLAQQAIMGLGVMADRKTGGIIIDLEGSRYAIDLLDVLDQKTKGNLTADEATEIKQLLGDLRARFVQIAQIVAQQSAQVTAAPAGAMGDPLASARAKPAGPIITE